MVFSHYGMLSKVQYVNKLFHIHSQLSWWQKELKNTRDKTEFNVNNSNRINTQTKVVIVPNSPKFQVLWLEYLLLGEECSVI